MTQCEEQASQPETEEGRLKAELDELTEESQRQITKKQDLEKELKQAREPLKMIERQRKQVDEELRKAKNELKKAKQRLEQRRQQIVAQAGSAESEEARRTQELAESEQQLQEAQEKEKHLRQETTDALHLYEDLTPAVQQAKENVEYASRRHAAIKNEIRELQNASGGDKVAIFGQNCKKLKLEVRCCVLFLSMVLLMKMLSELPSITHYSMVVSFIPYLMLLLTD